ncbi:MAG: hypothetical protein RIQ81_818 [Pseudomonadota bacterium]
MSQDRKYDENLPSQRGIDQLVDLVTSFRNSVRALGELYEKLPALIAAEHDAVVTGNFNIIRQAGDAKGIVCDEICAVHAGLIEQTRRIPTIVQRFTGRVIQAPATISESLRHLVDLAEALAGGPALDGIPVLAREILQRLLASSTLELEAFLELAEKAKPKVEANRLLLEKLAQSYQDSYRFWLEMASETQAPYDARGVQRTTNVASGIRVKA